MRASQTVTVSQPPAEVFRWIVDPDLARRWQPDVVGYEIVQPRPGLVGTQFRERVGDARGSVELSGEVTEFVPDTVIAFDIVGPRVHVRARYVVSASERGSTVRADADVQLGGRAAVLLERLAGGRLRRRLERQLQGELELLRRLCEQSSPE